ncbi:hypothetical protein [Cohnella sp. WQ 127256]|uniref:hypothetical protein n=1 Tax=Cohnella sp. WQ 127256 TaxID=2938790 RepID=UPI002117B05D|nr:hypothetical protein [Cohnella sp. WQ 127256]
MKYTLLSRIMITAMLASFTAVYSLVVSGKYGILPIPIGVGLVLIVIFQLLKKFDIIKELKDFPQYKYRKTIYTCTILSVISFMKQFQTTLETAFDKTGNTFLIAAAVVIVFVIVTVNFFTLWYLLMKRYLEKIMLSVMELSRTEKSMIYGYVAIFAIVSMLVLLKTSAFIYPVDPDGNYLVDVIFSTDSAKLLDGRDVFSSPNTSENDFRQLLFGIVAFPLAMIFVPISYFIHTILNSLQVPIPFEIIYGYLISVAQALLFAISAILIKRLLHKEMNETYANLFALLYLTSFSTLLFTMTIEQYAVSLLTLLVFVYFYVNQRSGTLSYIVAGTTLTSSFAMLPLVVFESRNGTWKTYLMKTVHIVLLTVFALVFFGQLYELMEGTDQVTHLLTKFSSSESLTMWDKIVQYYQFLPSMFIAPATFIVQDVLRLGEANWLYNALSAMIVLVVLSNLLYVKKSRLTLASMYWVLISFLLLGVVGWGTVEKSLILYSSYFGWAFLVLFALGYARLFAKHIFAGKSVLISLVLVVFLFNAYHIVQYIYSLGSFRA